MTYNRTIDLEVDVATLRHRVGALEARMYGRIDDSSGPQPLFDTYAHLLLDGIHPCEESAALLRTCVALVSPRMLLDLARMTGDMFPWRPFLAAVDLLHVTGFDMTESTAWLETCAQDLLNAQGMKMLRIEDVLRAPTGPIHLLKSFALSESRRST